MLPPERKKAAFRLESSLDEFWLPECTSVRTRPGLVETEIYFRIVHNAWEGDHGAPVAAYREQTVEIALGPKDAFENGHIGGLTRRVPVARDVSVVPPPRGKPTRPKEPKTPRVTELLRKAIQWHSQIESGQIANQAEIARQEGITRARVTQVIGMLNLAPEIQTHILALPEDVQRAPVTERKLRTIVAIPNYREQIQEFYKIAVNAS